MSETKFTPGPWHVFADDRRGTVGVGSASGSIADQILPGGAVSFSPIQTWAERAQPVKIANANLIAAAPALYEALAGIKWRSDDKDNMEFAARATCFQMDKIRAALASVDRSPQGGNGVAGAVEDESAVGEAETPKLHRGSNP